MIVKILTPEGRLHRQDRTSDKVAVYVLRAGVVRVEPDGQVLVFQGSTEGSEQVPLVCTFEVTLPPRRKGNPPEVIFSTESTAGKVALGGAVTITMPNGAQVRIIRPEKERRDAA
ncbi:hypothetical protein A3F07_02330 [candidate division WWE3 bacterium RIFCSPHIGHO2_12_FULL_38_15]|uniref:Uncharacterized protein n=1 Tax=candidate division WWE3 bacterium RIFCSPHIGHO2_02_FULL_38_14 TaxID=1802620 RepID=A0A1F4VAG1_UNCKA|nr:MAG: hypothetical protein A3F07_02330 [candidate division WWE3 bacterium RIFCSPHIGHO2_12_FULL_38_15]OGC54241.1 MAG: hypothetical protein A3D91_01705 [candidate division WWE3 bacterium RIFCSPHIGHO2_02_FULL_38_14]